MNVLTHDSSLVSSLLNSPPEASFLVEIFALSITSKNEGQPEPESYFVLEEN